MKRYDYLTKRLEAIIPFVLDTLTPAVPKNVLVNPLVANISGFPIDRAPIDTFKATKSYTMLQKLLDDIEHKVYDSGVTGFAE